MEENTPNISTSNPPPERTAEVLRELQERTRAALEAQRTRMGDLEAQLTSQLDAIAGQIAEQVGAQGGGQISVAVPDQQALDEIARLRTELERTRTDWTNERNAWETDRLRLMSDDHERANSLDARQTDLESRQHALDERGAQLNHRDRELCQRQALLDSYSTQCASQQSQLTDLETKLAQERKALNNTHSEVRATQALVEHQQNELAAREQSCQRDEATLAADRAMLQAEQEAFNAERDGFATERETFAAERETFKTERAEATAVNSATEELATQLANADQNLATEREAWEQEITASRTERRNLELERDELSSALAASRGELKTAKVHIGAVEERDELKQKFEIALDDLQRLRARVSELEQELTSRPAVNETDSVELVHLRSERDALAQQVAELEKRPIANADSDAAQDMADLQRRFELAVEDVRDLKKQNAQLEVKLVEAQSRPGAAVPAIQGNSGRSGGSSWESMKQQMLADLEGEGDDGDRERTKERATIENTIHITDEVVANKDREIASLKLQLVESVGVPLPAVQEFQEQIDADEVIRGHRERIAALEQEMQSKLRAAELELSVERAKIAREQAHLADLQAEYDAQRAQGGHGHGGGSTAGHPPKRRWLSKLGLSGDEE